MFCSSVITVCFKRTKKKLVFFSSPGHSSPSSSSSLLSSSNSRVSITPDRNGFKERELYQSLWNLLEGHLQVSDI